MVEAIRRFNLKPKNGVAYLEKNGLIPPGRTKETVRAHGRTQLPHAAIAVSSDDLTWCDGLCPCETVQAQVLADLFKTAEGFDKVQLGEYMGEGGPKAQFNIDVLHSFVDTYAMTTSPFHTQ